MSDYAKCVRNGVVEFGDDFSSRKEIMKLFGKENEGVGKSGIVDVGNGSVCFFDEKGRDGWNHVLNENGRLDRRGWNEVVEVENYSEEGLRGEKEKKNKKDGKKKKEKEEKMYGGSERKYVFCHMNWKGMVWWKFLGVFGFENRRLNERGVMSWFWKKVEDEVELVRWE